MCTYVCLSGLDSLFLYVLDCPPFVREITCEPFALAFAKQSLEVYQPNRHPIGV